MLKVTEVMELPVRKPLLGKELWAFLRNRESTEALRGPKPREHLGFLELRYFREIELFYLHWRRHHIEGLLATRAYWRSHGFDIRKHM